MFTTRLLISCCLISWGVQAYYLDQSCLGEQDDLIVYAKHLITRLDQSTQIFRNPSAMLSILQVLLSRYKVIRTFRIYQLFYLEAEVYQQLSVSIRVSLFACGIRVCLNPATIAHFYGLPAISTYQGVGNMTSGGPGDVVSRCCK